MAIQERRFSRTSLTEGGASSTHEQRKRKVVDSSPGDSSSRADDDGASIPLADVSGPGSEDNMYPSGIQVDSRFDHQSDEDDEDCAIPPRPRPRREIITEGCDPRTFVAKLFFPQCAVFAWQACDSRTDVCLATVCCCCFTLWCWEPLPRQRDLGRYAIEEAQQAPAQEELEEQDQDAAAMRKQWERDRGSAASIGTTDRTVPRRHAARRGSAPACRFLCITCDPRDWCCRCWFPATAVYAWEGCDYPWNNVLSLCCCCLFTVCCWAMAARQKKWGISVDQYEALLRRWQEREAGLVSAGSGGGAAPRRGERSRRLVVGDPMIAVSNFTNT